MSRITDYSFLFQSMFGTKSTKGASAIGSFQLSQLNSNSVQAQLRAAGSEYIVAGCFLCILWLVGLAIFVLDCRVLGC